jgi:hypothetical protein
MARINALNSDLQFSSGLPVAGISMGANSAIIVSTSGGVTEATASLTDGQILIGSTGATPALGTITAGTGISVTNGAGSITIASTSSDPVWSVVSGATSAVVNGAYITNSASQVVVTLPVTAAVGTSLSVAGLGAGGWKVAQNASQNIRVGSAVSTTGTGGYVESFGQYDSIQLVCIVADTTWTAFTGPLSAGLDVA